MKIAFIDLGSGLITFFSEAANHLPGTLQPFFFSQRPKVRSKLKRLGKIAYPLSRDLPKQSDSANQMDFKSMVSPKVWETTNNPDRVMHQAKSIYSSLEHFILSQEINVIFVWNGSGLTASLATHLARQHGLKTIYGENGYLPNTIQLDPEGVNFFASITSSVIDDFMSVPRDAATEAELRRTLDDYMNGKNPAPQKPAKAVSASLWSKVATAYQNLGNTSLRLPRKLNQTIPRKLSELPTKFILVPLQVVQDSQLILHSPLVGNDMQRFVKSCHDAVENAFGDEYRLVVKLHPADMRHSDYSALAAERPNILFTSHHPVQELIAQSEAVITINSTVGFEGLLYHKPVITLGRNFYTIPGITFPVDDLTSLPERLETALTQPLDVQRIDQFVYYIYAKYLTHGSWKNHSAESLKAVAEKIAQICMEGPSARSNR